MASCRLQTTQAKQCRWYTKSWARRTTCVGGMPSWHAAHLVPKRLRDAQGAAQWSSTAAASSGAGRKAADGQEDSCIFCGANSTLGSLACSLLLGKFCLEGHLLTWVSTLGSKKPQLPTPQIFKEQNHILRGSMSHTILQLYLDYSVSFFFN